MMKRSWPVHPVALLVLFCGPGCIFGQTEQAALAAAAPTSDPSTSGSLVSGYLAEAADIPSGMRDLMQNAQRRYLEGSNLIKLGDSTKARNAFNDAIDLLLQSEWDISSNPVLQRFFEDLIHRIQQDESRYLTLPVPGEEKGESAVVDELNELDLIPITVDPSLKDVVEADLSNTMYDIPVHVNERVMKSLNYWLNRGRKFFTDGLIRSGRYRDMIHRIFREEAIPLDVMYLAQVESLFKTNALSRAQAKGIWQFGKWTAIRYGLKVNGYIDERSDPEKSTRAAARYLNDLYGMFKDWNLVLAAYNWGEGRVQKLINRSGVNDFWDLMDLRRNFPQETKNHVPLIMASIILARNPEKYGLPKELDPPLTYERVAVSKPIDLKAAAHVMNTTVEELRALNPALRNNVTPAEYPDFELKVPVGTDPDAATRLAALPAAKYRPPPEFAGRYRVRPGDTLGRIAARHRVSVASLQKANNIRSPKSLRVGAWLTVPRVGTSAPKTSSSRRSVTASRRIKSNVKSAPIRTGKLSTKTQTKTLPRISSPKSRTSVKAAPTKTVPATGVTKAPPSKKRTSPHAASSR
jgi:membrane-bound lytic murein transglycosylase D